MTQMSAPLRLLQPAKAAIARGLCAPLVGSLIAKAYADLIPSDGLVFNTRSPLIAAGTKAAIYWGLYERDELRFVSKYLRHDRTVVELGSSIGVVACHIRRKIGPAGRLICVEASPQLSELLARNLTLNGFRQNVTILNKAIAYSNEDGGEVAFALGHGSASGRITGIESGENYLRIGALKLGTLLKNEQIDDFCLVADIEGGEAGFIFGDAAALSGCQQIVIELHDTTYVGKTLRVVDLFNALLNLGFKAVASHGPVCVFER
jgi:FkbM family methyltransferase